MKKFIASFFGIGFLPLIPATVVSAVVTVLFYFFWPSLSFVVKGSIILITFLIGVKVSSDIETTEHLHDPRFIVIDEVVGSMISFLLLPQNPALWILSFVLFRLFDFFKPWPASYFDRQAGGFGIMMDDVVAGGYTLLILYFFS